MPGPKNPLDFCNDTPDFGVDPISLPFGLPDVSYFRNCKGIPFSVPSINNALAAIYPLIKIAECALKIVEAVKAVPDSIGPPPDPSALIQKILELNECILLLFQFSGFGAIPAFCKMLRDIFAFCIVVLTCIRDSMAIGAEADDQLQALLASADPELAKMAECMGLQNDALCDQVNERLENVNVVLLLANFLVAALPPPISDLAGVELITIPQGCDSDGIAALDALVAALEFIIDPLGLCAGI